MKRAEHPLFLLTQKRALPPGNLTEEMVDALNDPEITAYTPAILSVICEWMELYQTHECELRPTEKDTYELELPFSFLECIEQFPDLVAWLREPASRVYHLDMDNQQANMRVELTRVGDLIHHAVVEDHWNGAKRIEGDVDHTPDWHDSYCKLIVQAIKAVAAVVGVADLPGFRDWCMRCGCESTAY